MASWRFAPRSAESSGARLPANFSLWPAIPVGRGAGRVRVPSAWIGVLCAGRGRPLCASVHSRIRWRRPINGRRWRMGGGDLSVLARRPLSLIVSRGAISAWHRAVPVDRQRRSVGCGIFAAACGSAYERSDDRCRRFASGGRSRVVAAAGKFALPGL